MDPSTFLYLIVIGFIRTVKWIELQFLKLFSPLIIKYGINLFGRELGVVFHLTDVSYSNWSPEDEKKALQKCQGKYDTLVHIRLRDPMLAVYAANTYSWAIGEGYVNGSWGACEGRDELDEVEFTKRFFERNFMALYYNVWNRFWYYLEFELFNHQTRVKAMEVGEKHYDLGNDMFEKMLDPWMQYSCAYWANASNLNEAQEAKLQLIAKKLQLKPGMRVLDIGCGWGTLCKYFALNYGVECVGVTISKEQAEYGQRLCKGLPVEIRYQDYRDVDESFDRILSIGMFEHVGPKNYDTFFKVTRRNLTDDGLFLLQIIGGNHPNLPRYDRWISTVVFPNATLPHAKDVIHTSEPHFVIEDWHNYGHDYSRTIHAWRETFQKEWPNLRAQYGDKFYRVWMHYFCCAEAKFASRRFQLWQIVFSKDGLQGGYRSVR